MKADPIIEEIRERRRKLFQDKYHGSIDELVAAGIKWEKQHPGRVVDLRKQGYKERMCSAS
jgi:hypothetical protein